MPFFAGPLFYQKKRPEIHLVPFFASPLFYGNEIQSESSLLDAWKVFRAKSIFSEKLVS